MSEIARQSVIVEWQADLTELERGIKLAETKFTTSTKEITSDLNQVTKAAQKTGDETAKSFDKANKASGGFRETLKRVGEIALGFNIAQVAERAATAVVGFFTDSSKAAKEFEASLSGLSAITGATGDDLQFLSDAAQRIGSTTTTSAVEAVEAFKLIGSAKPELLENKEALAAVTEQAITLSEAAGISLPEAATSLTGALNQFQLPASEAARVINVLAAGAKAGAAEVPETTDALKNFGVAASNAGVSVEESVAAIQLLAEFGIKGAEAGTSLRNVLSRLSAVDALPADALKQLEKFGVDLNVVRDNSLPVEERLRELGKISGDATALVKVFGLENQVAGQIVLGNVDKFSKYADAVTGTQDAIEQAKVNTDNFESDTQKLANAVEGIQIAIGGWINEALQPLARGLTTVVLTLREVPTFIKENIDSFKALAVGLVLFNAQAVLAAGNAIRLAAVQQAQIIQTRGAAIAQFLLNQAMTANPIGLVIKALALLGTGFTIAYQKSETFRAVIGGIGSIAKEVFAIVKETIGGFIQGFKDLTEGNIVEGLKKIGKAMLNANPITLAATQGKRLGEAFKKGYDDSKAAEAGKSAEKTAKDVAGAVNTVTDATKTNTTATVDNTKETDKNTRAKLKQADALSRIQQEIERQTEVLQGLEIGSDAFAIQALLVQALIDQAKKLKQEYEDALNPPSRKDILERRIKEVEEAISKIEPTTEGFEPLRRELARLRKELGELEQARERALNPQAVAKLDTGRLAALRRQLAQLRAELTQAAIEGNVEAGKEILKKISQTEAFIEAQLVVEGDQEALKRKTEAFTEEIGKDAEVKVGVKVDVKPEDVLTAKEQVDKIKEAASEALTSLGDIAQGQVDIYTDAVNLQQDRVARFTELAKTGSAEQLVIEEERLARLTELQERAQARQRRIAEAQLLVNQAITVSESVKAIAQAFGSTGPLGIITGIAASIALATTLASTASQVGGLFGSLPKFRDGSEFIQGKGTGTSDSILARVSKGERIVPFRENMEMARIGGIPNKKLPEAVAAWHSGPVIIDAIREGNEAMIQRMENVQRELELTRLDNQKTRVQILATRKGLAAMVSEVSYQDKFARR